MDRHVLGVDGCRSGWITCRCELSTRRIVFRAFPNFEELLRRNESAEFIVVDIPIGIWDDGRHRCCDVEARRILAPIRSSSVFPAPPRQLLEIGEYAKACEVSRTRFGKGISKQAHAIYRKVAEVDKIMTPKLQEKVLETHPELCFWRMNGNRNLLNGKKTSEGYEERRSLLMAFGFELPGCANWHDVAPGELLGVSRDDVLDAAAAAQAAYRMHHRKAETIPQQPGVDEKGLRMEMIY